MKKKLDKFTPADIQGTKLRFFDEIQKKSGLYLPKQPKFSPVVCLESLEELLEKDKQREKDGFPKKIKFRRVMVGPGKIITVPYVEEEKLIHGEFEPKFNQDNENGDENLGELPGSGEGEIGDVIGEMPIFGGEGEGEGDEDSTAGQGAGDHGIEEEAYELGKKISEKFQLPNLQDKGKKVPTDEYTYDLTDRHQGSGQVLDKQATLKKIVRTNLILKRVDKDNLDPTKMVVGPDDKIYRVLSRERVWKSQAVVFFIRDYSGSMYGEPTKAIITQHLFIYSWLLVQYEKMVIPRFILHDTEAEEVSVKDYFQRSAGGGTFIPSAYQKVNEIVENEGLARDYNIYIFQGTDGDDSYDSGKAAIPEIQKILQYVNRMGVCIIRSPYSEDRETVFEQYVKKADFLNQKQLFRMYIMPDANLTEEIIMEAVKVLTQD